MRLSKKDQQEIQSLYEEVVIQESLLCELTRQKLENSKKYGSDPNDSFKRYMTASKENPFNSRLSNQERVDRYKKDILRSDYKYTPQLNENKTRLVRALKTFIGVTSNDKGEVIFHREAGRTRPEEDTTDMNSSTFFAPYRKTVHFAVNGIVGDHGFNSWENANIIVVVDPLQIKQKPRATRLEDTWYMVDKNNELNVGKATILVPTDIKIPNDMRNAKIIEYSGDRKEALKSLLSKEGIEMLSISAHRAEREDGYSSTRFDSQREGRHLFKQLGATNWDNDSNMPHIYSSESKVEELIMRIAFTYRFMEDNNLSFQDLTRLKDVNKNEGLDWQFYTQTGGIDKLMRSAVHYSKQVRNDIINNKSKGTDSRYHYSRNLKTINDFIKNAQQGGLKV